RVVATSGVPNAAATVGRVMYNPRFFAQVRRQGGDSAMVGILAHEFGHISKKHVHHHQGSSTSSRKRELEADNEAGCALAKMGMSASGYVRVTVTLAGQGSYTHPGGAQRRQAIETGFARCNNGQPPMVAEAGPTNPGGSIGEGS